MQKHRESSVLSTSSDVRLAKSQAKREREVARCIIVIDHDGSVVETIWNDLYFLKVVAVVGPYLDKEAGVYYPETILLEVGFNRLYPYRDTWGTNGKSKHITKRNRFGSLSHHQFLRVWPELENAMYAIARQRIDQWKHKHWWAGGHANPATKTFTLPDGEHLRGVHFSVCVERGPLYTGDRLLMATVIQGEVNKRQKSLEYDTVKFIQHFSRSLCPYRHEWFTTEWMKSELREDTYNSRGLNWWKEHLERRKFSVIALAQLLLQARKKEVWIEELLLCMLEYIGVSGKAIQRSKEWSRMLKWKRVPQWNTHVYLWTGPNDKPLQRKGGKTYRDQMLVFELIPVIDVGMEDFERDSLETGEEDDIPFPDIGDSVAVDPDSDEVPF